MTEKWTSQDMIDATLEFWDDPEIQACDCRVREDEQGRLFVVHAPSNRTSTEAGDGGRWYADGTACE